MQVRSSRDVDRVRFCAALCDDVQPIGQTSQCVGNLRAVANNVVGHSELRLNTDVFERGSMMICGSMPMLLASSHCVAHVAAGRTERTAVLDEIPLIAPVQIPKRVDGVAFIDTNKQQRNGARYLQQLRAKISDLPVSKITPHTSGRFSSQAATIASLGDPHFASV